MGLTLRKLYNKNLIDFFEKNYIWENNYFIDGTYNSKSFSLIHWLLLKTIAGDEI